ncbi:hypothetical protein [Pseudoalteromonas luteoviolacea]|nr:hypothetical protein [Pseudoalteromonas luteoviolacea]
MEAIKLYTTGQQYDGAPINKTQPWAENSQERVKTIAGEVIF